jgi:serine/threonine protein phosphatase PrpC
MPIAQGEEQLDRPDEQPEDDTGELPTLLQPGDILAGRYRVRQVIESREGPVYRAEDLWRCPNCGSTDPSAGDGECRVCHASLDRRPMCTIRLVAGSTHNSEAHGGAEVVDLHGLAFLILPDVAGQAGGLAAGGLRLHYGAASHAGRVRQVDEDSVLCMQVSLHHLGHASSSLGLFGIADGIGGLSGGATASRLVLAHLAQHIGAQWITPEPHQSGSPPEELMSALADAVQAANRALYEQQPGEPNTMGTTLTAAYVYGRVAVVANVGDSRTYRWRGGHLEQLTTDHSMVASLVRAGLAQPHEIYTHPQKSLITRSLGDQPSVEVDTFLCDLAPGDRLLLCSDGVWEMLHDEEIEALLHTEPAPQQAAQTIIQRANERGGEDNLSAIVVACEADEDEE